MPACAEVNQAMEAITGVNFNTGEQNRDMTESMQAMTGRIHRPFSRIIYRSNIPLTRTQVYLI